MSQERGSRRPLVLERIVGGSVLAEQSPYSVDVMLRFRGVEILDADEPEHEGPVRGPYRAVDVRSCGTAGARDVGASAAADVEQ